MIDEHLCRGRSLCERVRVCVCARKCACVCVACGCASVCLCVCVYDAGVRSCDARVYVYVVMMRMCMCVMRASVCVVSAYVFMSVFTKITNEVVTRMRHSLSSQVTLVYN